VDGDVLNCFFVPEERDGLLLVAELAQDAYRVVEVQLESSGLLLLLSLLAAAYVV
jgi:hypothetical protein